VLKTINRKGEGMKHLTLFLFLVLTTSVAQANVFKCKTPEGIIYSEQPCPTGSTASSIRTSQAPTQQQSTQSGINNVNAVPLPVPEKQRGAYEAFLSRPNPKAFVICTDGRVMTLSGKSEFVDKQLSSLPAGCSPYAVNDSVVWTGK
jgi:hypothetical protein